VHALNGATTFSSWLGNWPTTSGYLSIDDRVIMGDVNADGKDDIVIISTGPTGSGRLEAHVLDASTGYSTWLAHWATASTYGNESNRYAMGDVNGDGRSDLVILGTSSTGSGRLEVHALDASSGYSTWAGHWATAAGYGNSSTDYTMGDVDADGRSDLILIATGPTGSGRLEAHVLIASTGFSTWLGNWPTAAGYGNISTKFVAGG